MLIGTGALALSVVGFAGATHDGPVQPTGGPWSVRFTKTVDGFATAAESRIYCRQQMRRHAEDYDFCGAFKTE